MVKCIVWLTKYNLFEYVGHILQTRYLGYDDHCVTDLDGIVASGNDDLTVTQDRGDENVSLEAEV